MACAQRHEPTIVVVTDPMDEHATILAYMLKHRGHRMRFVHPGDLARVGHLTAALGCDTATSMQIVTSSGPVDLDEVGCVWWRKPGRIPPPTGLPRNEEIFAERELNSANDALWRGMRLARPDIFWMSDPDRQRAAAHKIEQLVHAKNLGFLIPRTLISSEPAAVRAFYAEHAGDIVYKPSATGYLGRLYSHYRGGSGSPEENGDLIYCVPVDDELIDHLDETPEVPGIYQQRIPKSRELRVTVFKDQVFTAAVYSQERDDTRGDWRANPQAARWEPAALPDEVEKKCLEMLDEYGLTFGAFDFVETPAGEHVFLELNPNGQWMFVQLAVPQLKMAQTLCDIFMAESA